MSYADQVDRQAKDISVFATVGRKTKILGEDLQTYDGTRKYISFDGGQVRAITAVGNQIIDDFRTPVDLIEVASLAAVDSVNEYFYDSAAGRIYFYFGISGITDITVSTLIIEYRLYFSSSDINWYSTPTDDTTSMIKWTGGIVGLPAITRSAVDNYAGFSPSEISPLEIAITDSDLMAASYDEDFNGGTAEIWVCYGIIAPENIRKLFTGTISNVRANQTTFIFDLIENVKILNGSFVGSYFQDVFQACEPLAFGRAIPLVYGVPRWIKCINVDYIKNGASTSDNRKWIAYDGILGHGQTTHTLSTVGSPSGGIYPVTMSTADAAKLIDDQRVYRNSDGKWARIVYDGTDIELTPVAHTPAPGDVYTRPAIQEAYFQVPSKQGTAQNWLISDSATISSVIDSDCVEMLLTSGFEAAATTLGLTTIDPDDFEVWVRVIGPGMDQANSGAGYFEDDVPSEVGALLWYLRTVMGLSDSNINVASFETALTLRIASDNGLNQANFISPCWQETFEDHRSVINRLLQQIGAIAFFNESGQFEIIPRGVLGTADYTLTDSEIDGDSIDFEWNAQDRAWFQLDGSSQYLGVATTRLIAKPSSTQTSISLANGPIGGITSTPPGYTWGKAPVKVVELYDIGKDAQASGQYVGRNGISRIAQYFATRRGFIKLRAFGEIVDVVPGQTVSITLEHLPGFQFVAGTLRTKSYCVLSAARDGDSVELLLEDQYSIEEVGSF